MSNIKCFGCSFTDYKWPTWADFLHLSTGGQCKNYGITGASNEIISRRVIQNAVKGDTVCVMWSAFDREHSEVYFKKHDFCEGKFNFSIRNQDHIPTIEQLYHRSLECIWMTNKFCIEKGIKIINLSMTIFRLGEQNEITDFKDHLEINYRSWPIDLYSFCLDNKPVTHIDTDDNHPTPSQHYYYHENIVCPILELQPKKINFESLEKLDKQHVGSLQHG
jgi:hypothetical protein